MKKIKLKTMLSFFLVVATITLVSGCSKTQTKTMSSKESVSLKAKEVKGVTGDYQLAKSYPIQPKDQEHFDDSLITNQMDTFYGYKDQGKLFIKSNEMKAFDIFVNGKKIKVEKQQDNDWYQVNIGKLTINGDNKIQVSQVKEGHQAKLEIKIPYPELVDATKKNKKNDSLNLIDQIIQAEIKNGFTSAELVITKDGKMVKHSAYGQVNSYTQDGKRIESSATVTNNTLYDLASNTKMYATNYALEKLVSEGKIDVNQKVQTIFPEFKDQADDKIKGKNNLTIKEILQHQAGFPADPQYHNNNYDPTSKNLSTPNANQLYTQKREEVLDKIIQTPLEYQPGTNTQYSDVDYMLLGFIIEKVTGERLDTYMEKNYYAPLNLQHITFNPLQNGFKKDQIAATELNGNTRDGYIHFNNIRTHTIQGQVHDEKAYYTMGGISGHAGLFSNAKDLAIMTQITLNRGGYGAHKFFDETTMNDFIKPKDGNESYGLGWRRKGTTLYSWAFSPLADTSTVGHTGWVGTLTVIDPVNHVSIVLLTNSKNSPVLDKEQNPNDFVGNHYLTSGYGMVATLAFDSFENSNQTANDSKLIDMVTSKYNLIKEEKDYQTKPDKASLKALVQVLEQRKADSSEITSFLNSKKGQAVIEFTNQ
ncbi:penicillin binding protein PBP4B [Vagococcus entomophilus]|uniref:Penicillin binding protein PBP4B n=1 Tax=Vagococcus entomophilus TaxID=1160095 RepID=A0A430AJL7_9ENTE|nr:penicillin binding protein PBP4B [Vagococcus entomophilus]RSU08306.1 penicillin binding protein PBP4B [Vagococcus entomophilus]